MFIKNLTIALRSLFKNRGTTLISLFGLTIGLASCLLIGLYIWNELSFDRYHQNADRIYRVNRQFFTADGALQLHLGHLAPPFGPLLKNDFPDMQEVVRMVQQTATFRKEDQLFSEENLFVAEPGIFTLFDIPLVQGDPSTSLNDPFTLLLSESAAEKYFKGQNPVDQTLIGMGQYTFKITGVFKDFPYNSHFHPDVLASFSTMRDSTIYGEENLRTNWGNNSFTTFIMLPEGYPAKQLEAQFPAFIDKHMAGYYGQGKSSERTKLDLTALTDIHLHAHLDSEIEENGDIKRVYIFAIIAILVLFIACINYMNLSTARSSTRAREIGVRKVVGAGQGQIVRQFLAESFLLSLIATVVAMLIVWLSLPFFNRFLGQDLHIISSMLVVIPVAALLIAVVTSFLAGFYPALFLSWMKPMGMLKQGSSTGSKSTGGLLRKILVTGQFVISVGLIIATLVVYRQLKFMQNKDLGLDKDHVVTMFFYNELAERYESFRNELLSNPSVKNVARSSRIPSGRLLDSFGSASIQRSGDTLEQTTVDLKALTIDHRFVPTFNLSIAAGRNYREDQGADRFESFILNEAAARDLGWKTAEEAVGQRIRYGGRDAHIVGVLNDFNFESLHQGIQPMILLIPSDSTFFSYLSFKLEGNNLNTALSHIESVWKQFLPQRPFDYHFIDEDFGALYEAEQRQGRVFVGFAVLAILVAGLGLLGLTAFITQQRMKEIGVRRVLGANTSNIIGLLSKDFVLLVLLALIIASPLAYFFMDKWLQDFAYRIQVEWWVFAVAGIIAVAVAFLTVGYQGMKAALTNPVESLRQE